MLSVSNLSGNVSYDYDVLGQLVSETNGSTTYEYAYDLKGNITGRKTVSNEAVVVTDTFTYGAEAWEDRLTGYNNQTITYDSIGNPTSYLGATLTWRGRELSGYSKGNKQISYSYDVDGMRYQKIVKNNGTESARYDYVYSDGKLILLTHTANGIANTARFIYDSFGEVRGFILNNTSAYLYLKNGQGDIAAIVDESGGILVRYTYNAWGMVEFIVPFGVDPAVTTVLATVSPFTYRGYCYDFDIGMYYLQSRYYDPQICRFINADSTDYLGATGTLLSYNLFAYCENDAVDCVDETGTWAAKGHKQLTKDVASEVFCLHYLDKICNYNVEMDEKYPPFPPFIHPIRGEWSWIKNQKYHFNRSSNWKEEDTRVTCATEFLKKAIKKWKANKKIDGLKYLGYALHCVQDISAHGNVGVGDAIASHALKKGYDNFDYDWVDDTRQKVTKTKKYARKKEALELTTVIVLIFILKTDSKNYSCKKCDKK